jgi:hypothetical protein
MREWTKVDGPEIKPPFYEKVVGRPRKSRRKAPEEKNGGTKLSKHGVQIHCGYCKGPGHNRAGCDVLKADMLAEAEANGEEPVQEEQAGPSTKAPKKKRKSVHEHVSVPNPTRKPIIIYEYGDADVPEIRDVNPFHFLPLCYMYC